MRDFIIEQVFPSLTEYEDVLITREESKIYKEIDKVMGQAVLETLQIDEEIQGFESIEVPSIEDNDYPSIDNQQSHFSSEKVEEDKINKENNYSQHLNKYQINNLDDLSNDSQKSVNDSLTSHQSINEKNDDDDSTKYKNDIYNKSSEIDAIPLPGEYHEQQNIYDTKDCEVNLKSNNTNQSFIIHQITSDTDKNNLSDNPVLSSSLSQQQQQQQTNNDYAHHYLSTNQQQGTGNLLNETSLIKKTVRKPILKKTFALKKIGYKVIPYEDETDSRYSFTSENIVFVNKAHSTYKAECERGDEFLFRHITNIVAEVVVGSKYPEAKDILEIQNKLISEAIKIHDYSLLKK
jgi:hypothetical protein